MGGSIMNDDICAGCRFVVEMYDGTWQWCNKYISKTEKVSSCEVVQPTGWDSNPP